MKKFLAIASDHTGFELKEKITGFLHKKDIKFIDFGTYNTESVDYPDYTDKVTEAIIDETADSGILICGTGIGMSISANRYTDIKAALCLNEFMAQRSRAHNDANILIIGAKLVEENMVFKIIDMFLSTQFDGGRHNRRLSKIN